MKPFPPIYLAAEILAGAGGFQSNSFVREPVVDHLLNNRLLDLGVWCNQPAALSRACKVGRMLARGTLSSEFAGWNKRWNAPFGRPVRLDDRVLNRLPRLRMKVKGPFGLQRNSPTRRYEYPWVAGQIRRGERLLEIGGALSGLQFALAADLGCEIHNVDPFLDYGHGAYAGSPQERHAAMNSAYKTDVALHPSTIEEANLTGPFDVVYSVSTLEHLPQDAITSTLRRADELLRPGGRLVLTVDLFLDVQPFCSAEANRWGTNVSMAWLAEATDYRLIEGDRRELFGFPEFSVDWVLVNLGQYLMHGPQLAQLAVFQKPQQ